MIKFTGERSMFGRGKIAANMLPVMVSAALVVFSFSAAQSANTYSKDVLAGQSIKIDTFMGWNNDCSFQSLDVSISKKPTHGKASPKIVSSRISLAQVGSAGKCLGRSIRGLAIFYRSQKEFKGADKISVRMKVRGQSPVFFHYNITVY